MRAGANTPITEPEIVQCVFLSGGEVEVEGGVVRFTGWLDDHHSGERRICVRYALSITEARRIHLANKALFREGH